MKPILLRDIVKAVDGKISDNKYLDMHICNIATDTRKIKKGDFFVPIKGENFDGHDFIESAFEKGAVCCFSSTKDKYNGTVIYVFDTKIALRDLAQYYMSLFDIPVVAITGSVGKTTTKDITASVLSQKYNVLKTEGNFNNEIGLPLTVFNIDEKTDVAVLEMGMNNFGEIHNLSKIAKPYISIITNVGVSHIENLGSRENILKAKCEIFDFMKQNGSVILNIDDDMLATLYENIDFKIYWYGIYNKKYVYAENIIKNNINSISCDIFIDNEKFNVCIPSAGEHMVLNAMAATIAGKILGVSLCDIKRGIEEFVPSKMRMSIIKTDKNITIINDVYNANPVSMKSAIDVICESEYEKICILGDMLELGEFAENMHYDVGLYAGKSNIDKIVCIGMLSKKMYEGAIDSNANAFYFKTKEDFFENGMKDIINSGSTVLVKASRGMNFEKIVDKVKEMK